MNPGRGFLQHASCERHVLLSALLLLISVGLATTGVWALEQPSGNGLRIVVVEGEDAVNIVMQKTAVAPIVEVRDRNDQPVAGAVVRFAIRSGKASFGGPRTLVITTNNVGRAAATTLTPTGTGTVQITATAAFQGQTAAVTIAQTNVMTAAAASGASSGAGAVAGGSGASGGGGGVSATTIAVLGGAAAGGTIVVDKTILDHGTKYTGNVNGDLFYTFPAPSGGCTRTHHHTGTLNIHLKLDGDNVSGSADADGTEVVTASTCGPNGPQLGDTGPWGIGDPTPQLHGTKNNFTFTWTETNTFPGGTALNTFNFSGSLNGDTITGTLTFTRAIQPSGSAFGSFPVTLGRSS